MYILLKSDIGSVTAIVEPVGTDNTHSVGMLFHIVNDGLAGLDSSDVGCLDFLASEDGVNTPADGAGQWIVEHNVDFAHF